MKLDSIRKIVTYCEDTFIEGGQATPSPLRLFAVAAVLKNPWAGIDYVEDLTPEIHRVAPLLGEILVNRMIELAGSGTAIEAFGKAAIAGTQGEIEHAAALIHTLHFGNVYRKAAQAKTSLSFTNIRGGVNCPITIPMMHKNDAAKRSHYLTIQFSIPDAPAPDEIVIAIGASNGGRSHHRIGDREQDLAELGNYGY